MTGLLDKFTSWYSVLSPWEVFWLAVGFAGQIVFSIRFLVQWIASERARKSVIPRIFWYFSIVGALMLLAYAIYRNDPVFILGMGANSFIYLRNIVLLRREDARLTAVPAVADPGQFPD